MASSTALSSCSTSIPTISPPSSSSSKSPNSILINLKTLAFPAVSTSPKPLLSNPLTCISLSSSFHCHGRRVFSKLRASVQDAAEHSGEEQEDMQEEVQAVKSEVDLKLLPNVETLIKAYKEAVLSGDDKATSDIETKLCMIENKKNELVQKTSSLQAEMNSGKERYIRLQADFENFRKRSEKEKLTVTSDAKGEVIESLLAMVDSFERARQQIKTETEKEDKIDKSYQGIYKQFVEIMRSLNVAAIPTVGRPFDPSIHEAIAREESEEFKEGIVMQEIRRGFLLGDWLLRPATVKVSLGPATKEVPGASEEPAEQAAAGVDES